MILTQQREEAIDAFTVTYWHTHDGTLFRRYILPDDFDIVAIGNEPGIIALESTKGETRFPWLIQEFVDWLRGPPPYPRATTLVEIESGRSLGTIRYPVPTSGDTDFAFSRDGRMFVVISGNLVQLFDIPLRPSTVWFVSSAGVLALALAGLVRWRVRRLRRAVVH